MTEAERHKLIRLVKKIRNVDEYEDWQTIRFVERFKWNIPHPAGSDLIWSPQDWGLAEQATAEEIVDFALAWQPVFIVVQIVCFHTNGPYFVYRIVAPGKLESFVVSFESYDAGERLIIATSGTFYHGELVKHRLVQNGQREYLMFTIGELVSKTDLPVGTILESVE